MDLPLVFDARTPCCAAIIFLVVGRDCVYPLRWSRLLCAACELPYDYELKQPWHASRHMEWEQIQLLRGFPRDKHTYAYPMNGAPQGMKLFSAKGEHTLPSSGWWLFN